MTEGFALIRSLGGITEYRLTANGLTVLILPDNSVPVATAMITYRVGSGNEGTGYTGATHLLEHMMFKGSSHFNDSLGNSLNTFLESIGARFNATTWLDRTNYYATVGTEHLGGYLAVEADRMRELRFTEAEVKSEISVVCDELERSNDQPVRRLSQEIFAAAFAVHPYHHPTIGWRGDVEAMTESTLRAFYDTYYWPNNATLSIIGDVETDDALEMVKNAYGSIAAGPNSIPAVKAVEPLQMGPRQVTIRREGQAAILAIGHKIPSGTHPDYPALAVLATILSHGKNSRLHLALVDKNLVMSASSSTGFHRHPSLFMISLQLPSQAKHADIEPLLLGEIERIKESGVTELEVSTALTKLKVYKAFRHDGTAGVASSINECIAAGDWTLFHTLDAALVAMTAAEVQRVARTYLRDDQRTTGWFVPIAKAP